ncbi:MAG: dienelactone hydrolase family protein [Anaerolineae bacterium]|nr:dienelactone hydrolase family protein [Anaerolineae bacterium]
MEQRSRTQRTWWTRILWTALGLPVLLVALLAISITFDSFFGSSATDFTNVSFTGGDGAMVHGYLARPEGASDLPAVLMIHEWWGLNQEIIELADRMAEAGYVVLAPDTYRTKTTGFVPRALWLRITVAEKRVMNDLDAAYGYVSSLQEVDNTRIGVVGFCYGGDMAFAYGTQNEELKAVVTLYGATTTDTTTYGALLETGGPVLAIFGAEDQQIPVTEAEAFERTLSEAGIENQVTLYPGVGHAFVQPDVIDEPGAPQDAWNEILVFLDKHLQSVP